MPRFATLSLLLLGLLLPGLLLVPAYQGVYWSHPLVFVSLTTLGVAAALVGGFLAGRGDAARPGHLARGIGAALALAGAALGAAAVLLALSIAGTGYWYSPPHDYSGDYLPLLLQMRLSQAAALPGIAGGLLLGLGTALRRTPLTSP